MNGFIERFEQLLQERNERRSDFCRNTKIKESTIRGWIKGQTPNVESALLIADYFGVSVKWLFTGEDVVLPAEERQLLEQFRKLNDERKKVVLTVIEGLSVTN